MDVWNNYPTEKLVTKDQTQDQMICSQMYYQMNLLSARKKEKLMKELYITFAPEIEVNCRNEISAFMHNFFK